MKEVLPDLALWRRVQEAHRGEAHPPRRTGEQVAAHLAARYPAERLDDARFSEVVLANLQEYPYASLPPEPRVRAFRVRREAAGAALYAHRDRAVYGETPILVGIELETGFVHCEGSDELQEELFLYQGLSDAEWENPFLAWRMLTRCSG